LQRPECGIEVIRRCVDHGELLGVALRERPRAVVVSAELPWLDRELVGALHDVGVSVVAVESAPGSRALERIGVAHRLMAPPDAEVLAGLVHRLAARSEGIVDDPPATTRPSGGGRLIAVWGGPGAPGRTSVAVHLALDHGGAGGNPVLVDGDSWAPAVVQLLGLPTDPALTTAVRDAANGWPAPLTDSLLSGPDGLRVLGGLPRADLWPEVRERSWREVLDAARGAGDVVVVDVAAPIEEDEELSFDRVPFRRNLMSRVALAEADQVLMVIRADPIGLRHGIFAYRMLVDSIPAAAERVSVVLNQVPASSRRLQDCSKTIEEWTGHPPIGFLPREDAFVRVVWEGRPLTQVAPRSRWLKELRLMEGIRR
jgi:MinD-like ATPase involved in chromosome partitioning or flagellar assembly